MTTCGFDRSSSVALVCENSSEKFPLPWALTTMPHSFSELNLATCDSNRLASVPNHGCQTLICVPRRALGSTSNVLTAGAGVSRGTFSVTCADGVWVVIAGVTGAHAEDIKIRSKSTRQ